MFEISFILFSLDVFTGTVWEIIVYIYTSYNNEARGIFILLLKWPSYISIWIVIHITTPSFNRAILHHFRTFPAGFISSILLADKSLTAFIMTDAIYKFLNVSSSVQSYFVWFEVLRPNHQ